MDIQLALNKRRSERPLNSRSSSEDEAFKLSEQLEKQDIATKEEEHRTREELKRQKRRERKRKKLERKRLEKDINYGRDPDDEPPKSERFIIARRLAHMININIIDEEQEIKSEEILEAEPFTSQGISQLLIERKIWFKPEAVSILMRNPQTGAMKNEVLDQSESLYQVLSRINRVLESSRKVDKTIEKLKKDVEDMKEKVTDVKDIMQKIGFQVVMDEIDKSFSKGSTTEDDEELN